jgi:hypothetical protein
MLDRRDCEGVGDVKREQCGDCGGKNSQGNYAIRERVHNATTAKAAGGCGGGGPQFAGDHEMEKGGRKRKTKMEFTRGGT